MTLSSRISQGLNQQEPSERCKPEETGWDECLHEEPDCWGEEKAIKPTNLLYIMTPMTIKWKEEH